MAEYQTALHKAVRIPVGNALLDGDLQVPEDASGVVLFAHGSGSSRNGPRTQFLAEAIRQVGIGTLLFDLLTQSEEPKDAVTCSLRFDIPWLARRLVGITAWVENQPEIHGLKVGYCGSSTGSAAALMAAAELGDHVAAVVSRGGRPDLAREVLPRVKSPTLLIVGGYDETIMFLNEEAYEKLHCVKNFRIVPGATHLFDEPGKLEQVAQLTAHWFGRHMGAAFRQEKNQSAKRYSETACGPVNHATARQ